MDESGRLGVAIGRGERGRVSLPVPWPKLTIEDRKSLALAVLRDDVPADHALAAFYLLAAGLDEDAERHLGRAGDAARSGQRSCPDDAARSGQRSCPDDAAREVRAAFEVVVVINEPGPAGQEPEAQDSAASPEEGNR